MNRTKEGRKEGRKETSAFQALFPLSYHLLYVGLARKGVYSSEGAAAVLVQYCLPAQAICFSLGQNSVVVLNVGHLFESLFQSDIRGIGHFGGMKEKNTIPLKMKNDS